MTVGRTVIGPPLAGEVLSSAMASSRAAQGTGEHLDPQLGVLTQFEEPEEALNHF